VRAPQNDLTATKKIMEMGVDGIVFPMIRNATEANEAISNTLYPPYGTRGCGPINAIDYGASDIMEYIATDHEKTCRFIQIEHIDAVKDLEEIMKNDFIDGYIIGASDLSGSINELGNIYGENNLKLVKETISVLKAHGKYVGFATGETSEKIIKFWKDLGVDMITAGLDFVLLTETMKRNRENLSKIFKEA
jgi:2-dehydro-3-deoxyglucarate aldolase/4-hydroxy-2-oxoheptanedioate aldolase